MKYPTLKEVSEITSRALGISLDDIYSKSRKQDFVYARCIIVWYTYNNRYSITFGDIGESFGRCDGSAIRHNYYTAQDLIDSKNEKFCKMLKRVLKAIKQAK